MSRPRRGEVDAVYRFRNAEFENYISACPCGGIGRRVGLKIQSGFTLGASSSLAKGIYKRLTYGRSFFIAVIKAHLPIQKIYICPKILRIVKIFGNF